MIFFPPTAVVPNPNFPQATPMLQEIVRQFEPSLVPEMYQIAMCESTLRQWDDKGNVIVSTTIDYGILQINGVHEEKAKQMGLDFKNSIEDNVKMAKVVFVEREKQGLNGLGAWSCAKKLGFL